MSSQSPFPQQDQLIDFMLTIESHESLRQTMAHAFLQHTTTELCWLLGAQAETPGVAFFIAYQAALRCLDPGMPSDHWGAFCASEKGVRSPFLMKTEYRSDTGQLKGQKSFVMQVGQRMDSYYVLARRADTVPVELCLLKLMKNDFLNGSVQFAEVTDQPFMCDVPHRSMQFDMQVSPDCLFLDNAHQKANKPFRYWEDVHVLIALSAWFLAKLPKEDNPLQLAVQKLQEQFHKQPEQYSLPALDAFDAVINRLTSLASYLPSQWQSAWQRDAMLLTLTAPLRHKIRSNLAKG